MFAYVIMLNLEMIFFYFDKYLLNMVGILVDMDDGGAATLKAFRSFLGIQGPGVPKS